MQAATQNVLQGGGDLYDPSGLCLYSVGSLGKRGVQQQSFGSSPASCILRLSPGVCSPCGKLRKPREGAGGGSLDWHTGWRAEEEGIVGCRSRGTVTPMR